MALGFSHTHPHRNKYMSSVYMVPYITKGGMHPEKPEILIFTEEEEKGGNMDNVVVLP